MWKLDISKAFTVKTSYDFLLFQPRLIGTHPAGSVLFKNYWVSYVPCKVLAFSWKLLWDWLPTYSNLLHRNVFTAQQMRGCVLCGHIEESA